MDSEYQSDSEPNHADPDEFRPTFKKLTKNQQIYGDFEYAYEPEPTHNIFSKKNAYEQFRAGATIETYSSQVQVDLPISKPKKRSEQQQQDDRPVLGKFTLNSFLNSLADDSGLREIVEEDEDSSQNLPQGLNQKILARLQLVRFGEETQDQPRDWDRMDLQSYLKMNRPKQVRAGPKYKTQQEKELAQDFSQNYGVGFKMLEKMGYKVTKGLGKEETGIQRPVEAVMKTAFTMKDEEAKNQKKEEDSEKQEQTKQLSIPQKLFQYRSKDRKINDFLLDIKTSYERLQSQIYNCQAQIDSILKEEDLNESLRCQSQNQLNDLSKGIQKLEDLQANIYSCEHYPHLGLHYKLDQLYVRQLYDQLLPADLADLAQFARPRIDRLLTVLHKFYLAKARESLREFEESTGIESRLHKNILKGRKKKEEEVIEKKEEEVIDLDEIGEEKGVSIGLQDQQKMRQFVEAIISKCILPKVALALNRATGIQKVSDLRVIDVLEMAKKYDQRGSIFKDFLTAHVVPKCKAYLETFSLQGLQTGSSKMPSQVVFPWLTVVRPEELNLMNFYRRVAGKLWSIQNSVLLNLVKPWLRFSSQAEVAFLQNLYLAPRLLYEMQQFSINDPNPNLLTGFTQYCELLAFQQREEIMENTLLLQVLAAYREYKSKMEQGDVEKWLLKWKKFADKLAPGFFKQFMEEHGVIVQ